jgi:hypothetical protein
MLEFFVMWRETIVHDMTPHLIPAKDPLFPTSARKRMRKYEFYSYACAKLFLMLQ